MTIAFDAGRSALFRAYAPARRPPLTRRMALALGIAAALHAAIGFGVWNAKFRPHYDAPAAADVVDAQLVRPPPPPPPPPPPKQQLRRAPPRPAVQRVSPPPRMLRPRPARVVADIAPPQVLPLAPAPAAVLPPTPPVLAAAPAAPPAPKPPERIHVITNPDWLRTPNGDDLARYYPDRAQRNGVEGKATINCAVNEGGGLADCRVASEAPGDQGFGDAAMKMAGAFRMRPETRDGVPVAGARISIPIRFVLPDA